MGVSMEGHGNPESDSEIAPVVQSEETVESTSPRIKESKVSKDSKQKAPMSSQTKIAIFFGVAVLFCVVLRLWDAHSWKIVYDVVSTETDDRGVNHHVLYSEKYDVTFDFMEGSYTEYIFDFDENDDDKGWAVETEVRESNYAGKFLYKHKAKIEELFQALPYKYELIFDDENQIYEKAIVYVNSLKDTGDKAFKKILHAMENMVPSSRVFSPLNKDNYGRIEFFNAISGTYMYSKRLYLY
jgi:hypothetical protein